MTLTGANTYGSGTIISTGILQIGNGGTTGSITGNTTNNSALTFNRSDALTYSDVISGTGSLTKQGGGTLTLTGTNTYNGGTTISAGTLQIGNGGTTGSVTGNITNNSALTFNRSDAVTYANVISGTGSLTKQGGDTLTLTGANTHSGGTTISAGTLQIGNGGTTGSVNGNITNNSALTFNRSDALNYAGDISGTGSLNKQGSDTLTLTGANTHSGGTTISAGTLQIGNGGTTGSINGNITNNSALIFNRSDALAYSGDISGTGSLTKQGTGTLTLAGDSTHAGGTTISAGTLQIGNGGTTGSISDSITNNSVLTFNRSDAVTYANVISGTGSLAKQGGDTLTLTGANTHSGGTTISAGTLQIGNGGTTGSVTGNITNNSVLTINRSDAVTYANVISGTGSLTQAGTGSINLTNTNTYNGATKINSGTLFVNGSNSNSTTTVNAGGTLGGTGTVGSVNVSGGTFAPGNSIGTTNVTGNIDFSGGGVYQVEVDNAGSSDLIIATGTASLTGGSVQVLSDSTENYLLSTDYTILTADSGLVGVFNNVTSNLAFLEPTLTYDANNVFLNLTRNDINFTSVATTPNQIAVSKTLDNNATSLADIIDTLLGLTILGSQQTFDSLSGVQHTHGQQLMLFGLSQQFQHLLFDRIGFNPTSSLAFNSMQGPLLAYQGVGGPLLAALGSVGLQDTLNKERGWWLKGMGSFGEIDADANASGADYDTKGFAFGIDTDWRNGVIGLAGSYTQSDANTFGGSTEVDSFQASVYGGWENNVVYMHASVGSGVHDAESSRSVVVGATTRTASADYDSYHVSASVEIGKHIPLKLTTTLTPYIGIDFNRVDRENFIETGAGTANLAVKDNEEVSLRTRVGLRLSHTITNADGSQLTPYLHTGYVREFLDNQSTIEAGFSAVPTATFNTRGVVLERNRAEFGAGITGQLNENTSFNIGYDGGYAGSDDNHTFSATIRFLW